MNKIYPISTFVSVSGSTVEIPEYTYVSMFSDLQNNNRISIKDSDDKLYPMAFLSDFSTVSENLSTHTGDTTIHFTLGSIQNNFLSANTFTNQVDFNINTTGYVSATTFYGNLDWSYIRTKPTTISGYGITDTYTKTEINNNFLSANTFSSEIYFNINSKKSITAVTFYGSSNGLTGYVPESRKSLIEFAGTGLISGGVIIQTDATGFTITSGIGYISNDVDSRVRVTWNEFTGQTIVGDGTNYIKINNNGLLDISNNSNYEVSDYIELGYIFAGGGIIIDVIVTPKYISKFASRVTDFALVGVGALVENGLTVSESGQCQLYFAGGQITAALNRIPLSATTQFTKMCHTLDYEWISNSESANTIDVYRYNKYSENYGSHLSAMTNDYWKVDVVFRAPSGDAYLVYGQNEYSTRDLALAAPLPIIPADLKNVAILIAKIFVQKGTTSVSSDIVDIRPYLPRVFGFGSASAGSVQSHGSLLDLDVDDHTQYHNDTRGDARYYSKTISDSLFVNKSGDTMSGILHANVHSTTLTATTIYSTNIIVNSDLQTPVATKGYINGYYQTNIQNLSSDVNNSTDIVATNDNGSETTNYIDVGINGSNYSVGTWTMSSANDGYLYTSDGNLTIGTVSNKDILFHTNGTLSSNVVLKIGKDGVITNTKANYSFPTASGTSGYVLTSNGSATTWSLASSYQVKTISTSSYTSSYFDYILVNSATCAITLPAALKNYSVKVKCILYPTYVHVKTPSAGILIDGEDRSSNGFRFLNQYEVYTFTSDGLNWWID